MGDTSVEVALRVRGNQKPSWERATARLCMAADGALLRSRRSWSTGGQPSGVVARKQRATRWWKARGPGGARPPLRAGWICAFPIEQDRPENRANNIDSRGRAWVGTECISTSGQRNAALYRVDGDQRLVVDGLTISDGQSI